MLPGARVLLVLNDEPAFASWFLGRMRAGVLPVPLSTMSTAQDLAVIAADAEPDAGRRLGRLRGPRRSDRCSRTVASSRRHRRDGRR